MSTANEEIGAILGGMIAWDHAIQNSLTDCLDTLHPEKGD